MGSWVWIVAALVVAVAGALLLSAEYWRRTAHGRERRRWARLRGWGYVESDSALAARWQHGALGRTGLGLAKHVVTGRLFTAGGRRQAHLFDFEQDGASTATMAAVQCRSTVEDLVVELWMPSEALPEEPGLALLGPVGGRYAFTNDLAATRPLIVPGLADAGDELGSDVPVVWLEQGWVLASLPDPAAPVRLQRLLRVIGEIADEFDIEREDRTAGGPREEELGVERGPADQTAG